MRGYELTLGNKGSHTGIQHIVFSDLSPVSLPIPEKQEAPNMAREVIETFKDDIDGSPAEHIGVRFAFENNEFSIDLSNENYTNLKYAIEKYADHATKVSGSGRGRGRAASTGSASSVSPAAKKQELAAVRDWAAKNNIEVAQRGRISESVLHAYKENDPSLVGG